MPNMTGIELLEALRAEENEVTLGFITTESTVEMRKKASDAGAALSMIPAPAANGMIAEKSVTEDVKANFHEVMNICSKLMLSDKSPHLRLVDVQEPGASTTQIVTSLDASATTVAFEVEIPRYGKGYLGFSIE